MMNRNAIDLSGRLFARKGEAAPATRASVGGVVQANAAAAAQSGPSPLSFLIERRVGQHAVAADDRPVPASAPPVNGKPLRLVAASTVPEEPRPPRRQLTLRLQPEDFERFRFLVETYGATYQSVLERAVTGYVEGASPDRSRRGVC